MLLEVKYPESFSRGELLLRTFFGLFYIIIPHAFLLLFYSIASVVLNFLAFWVILFTGRYPESWFEFQVKFMRWSLRLNLRILNIADGYPAFGLNGQDENLRFEVPYPDSISRGSALLRFFFGWIYVVIPHGIILMFLYSAVSIVSLIAFWIVLFTGRYPKSLFDFNVYYLRWSQRVSLYLGYMTDRYPPFHGEADEPNEDPTVLDAGLSNDADDSKSE